MAAIIESKRREIVGFRERESFFNRVYDRLYAIVERYVFIDEEITFTLFLAAIPRTGTEEIKKFEHDIQYQGINKQKELLEKSKKAGIELSLHWDELSEKISGITGLIETKKLYKKFLSNEINTIEDCFEAGTLKEYFPEDHSKFTDFQKQEYPILNEYFDIEKDRFISIPLLQFGELDGVVHVIYEDKGHSKLYKSKSGKFKTDNIKDLIAGFSLAYEGVIFAWHLSAGTIDLSKGLPEAIDKIGKERNDDGTPNKVFNDFWEHEANNILKILNYKSYYTTHYTYYQSRISQHQRLFRNNYIPLLRQAVITILLDSYAHNISAHALTTLSWIYSKRSARHARSLTLKMIKNIGASTNRFSEIDPYRGAFEEIINLDVPLALELYPLFKFLQEKGGFWSGLTRDANPGGLTADMFDVLWEDFIGNSLYLGTIADSEEVRTLHLHVTIYQEESLNGEFLTTPEIEFEGHLATISLQSLIEHEYVPGKTDDCYVEITNEKGEKDKLWYDKHPELEPLSRFVQPGWDFEEFKERLRKIRVFLPGGVVGKHAIYNIIENELRNIKHFTPENLAVAKRDGLKVCISIQKTSLSDDQLGELYKIGVWLGLPAPLEIDTKGSREEKEPYLLYRRFNSLWQDVTDEENEFRPRLSGNNQDKVCAAMLFNGQFSSVQDGSQAAGRFMAETTRHSRDVSFYPWVIPAVADEKSSKEFQLKPPGKVLNPLGNIDIDPRLDKGFKVYLADSKNQYDASFAGKIKTGYLKKYFYVWRGNDILPNVSQGSQWDNTARFRIVYDPENDGLKRLPDLRRSGIIRVLPFTPGRQVLDSMADNTPKGQGHALFEAYKEWLRHWLSEKETSWEIQDDKGNPAGLIVFDKRAPEPLTYYTTLKVENANPPFVKAVSLPELGSKMEEYLPTKKLQYAHASGDASPTALLYRKHGVMNRYFIPSNETKDLNLQDMTPERFAEWFEMMAARICIVDNRIQHRMKLTGRDPNHFRDKAGLLFCSEDEPQEGIETQWTTTWDDVATKQFIKKSHFLVLHLSFIENLLQHRHHHYDGDVGYFVEKELLPLFNGKLPHNFILTVTSGRGRSKWWDTLPKTEAYKDFVPHIIFRPIESLLSAVEGSATQKDDFELKYRFTKVLFGS